MEFLIYVEDLSIKQLVSYSLEFVNTHPAIPKGYKFKVCHEIAIASAQYGTQIYSGNKTLIPAQNLFFGDHIVETSSLSLNPYYYKSNLGYSVENKAQPKRSFFANNTFGFDWIETIFFHLSRYEEVHFDALLRNQWDMMPEKSQILVKNNLYLRPILDDLVRMVLEAFEIPPVDFKSSFQLTHDVDYIFKPVGLLPNIKMLGSIIKRAKSIGNAIKYINGLRKSNWYDDFTFLSRQNYFTNKTIYFLVGGNHKYDVAPSLERNEKLILLALNAKEKGYQLGFHPSYMAAQDDDLFAFEKLKLEKLIGTKIKRSRQHYLHFDFSKTISILENHGIISDSSLGFNEHIGFRCGTGVDFRLFNWETMQMSSVIEKPLAWMDSNHVLYGKQESNFKDQVKDFVDINKNNTSIVFNIHNSTWEDYRYYGVSLSELYDVTAP